MSDDLALDRALPSTRTTAPTTTSARRAPTSSSTDDGGVARRSRRTDDVLVDAEVLDEDDDDDDEEAPARSSPYDRPGRWYVVHTQSGYEKKVKQNLETRIASMNMEDASSRSSSRWRTSSSSRAARRSSSRRRCSPATCWCAATSTTTPGTSSATPRASPASSARAPSRRRCRRTRRRDVPRRCKPEGDEASPSARKPRLEYEVGETRPGQGGPVRRLLRPDRRDQRGPAQAQGARQHLRPGDPGRARVRPGRQALAASRRHSSSRPCTRSTERHAVHGQEEGRRRRQDPDPRRQGHAGAAGRHRARPPRRGDHGLLQGVQRRHRGPAGHDRPRRDHDLRGPLVHVHPQDAAHAGAAARRPPGSRRARRRPGREDVGHGHRGPGRPRSPRPRCPTSTPTTSRRPSCRSPARPAPWASRSSERSTSTTVRPGPPRPAGHDTTREPPWRSTARSTSTPPGGSTATQLHTPTEALDLVKSWRSAKFDETVELAVRLGVDPRKADQMVRGTVALPGGHRQGRAGGRVRRRRRRRRGPRRRRRHRGRRRPGRRRSRGACSTSTSPSPRPT